MAQVIVRLLGKGARSGWNFIRLCLNGLFDLATRVGIFRIDERKKPLHLQNPSRSVPRNVPQIEVLRDNIVKDFTGPVLRIASVGCGNGAEFYFVLWMIRQAAPETELYAHGVDKSPLLIEIATRGIYSWNLSPEPSDKHDQEQSSSLAADVLSFGGMFDWISEDDCHKVKPWLRKCTRWSVCDAADPDLLKIAGRQDILVANHLLDDADDEEAEACIRNLVLLLKPGGYLLIEGLQLDLKSRITSLLRLDPVLSRVEDIYNAYRWNQRTIAAKWHDEALDTERSDWRHRYATIFTAPATVLANGD